jgi:hypothetical protein
VYDLVAITHVTVCRTASVPSAAEQRGRACGYSASSSTHAPSRVPPSLPVDTLQPDAVYRRISALSIILERSDEVTELVSERADGPGMKLYD